MLGTSVLVAWSASDVLAVGVCAHDSNHWYAQAVSGYPSLGTRVYHSLPAESYVLKSSNGTSDEAAWIINHSDGSNAIEGGFFTGWWPYAPGGWFTTLMPYITFDNGLSGAKGSSALSRGSNINFDVISGGSSHVGSTTFTFTYGVPNGVNFSQGEVTGSTQNWMDDKAGTYPFYGSKTSNGTTWVSWDSHSDCRNTPYFISVNAFNSWFNGGGLFNG